MIKNITLFYTLLTIIIFSIGYCQNQGEQEMPQIPKKMPLVFASFAETQEQIDHVYYLAESIRQFGGKAKNAPIWLYLADYNNLDLVKTTKRFKPLKVEVFSSSASKDALEYYYAGKVFGAGYCEAKAEKSYDYLVWMDDDTILLDEPVDFLLEPGISFAYRPVMHNRSGTLYGQPPNPYWARIYEVLNIKSELLFEMTTPADQQKVNVYFNAGLVVVRPQKGILRKWGDNFTILYNDSVLVQMCKEDINHKIFLHQTALVGAVLNTIERAEMVELPEEYNYPLFFEQMFGAKKEFGSIKGIKSLRYDVYFRNPDPEWHKKIKGPDEQVEWIKQRLGK